MLWLLSLLFAAVTAGGGASIFVEHRRRMKKAAEAIPEVPPSEALPPIPGSPPSAGLPTSELPPPIPEPPPPEGLPALPNLDAVLALCLEAKEALYLKGEKVLPKRAEKELEPALKVFGESLDDDAYFLPVYMKDLGCKNMRWGFCFADFLDHLDELGEEKIPYSTHFITKIRDWLLEVARWLSEEGVGRAEWLLAHGCLRFKFPMLAFEDQWGNQGWAVSSRRHGLSDVAPPHPYPKRLGWKRAWFTFADNVMKNDQVVTILWAEDDEPGEPLMRDLASTSMIRAALKVDHNISLPPPGPAYLASSPVSCGTAKFWPALRKRAMREWS